MSRYIGNVSAYAYAVEKGYTGTEEEFALLMASYATVGQTAVEAAQTATTKASEASQSATTATNMASEATTAAQTAINKAAEAQTSAQTASTKASEASTASTAAQTAKTQTEQSASQALTDIAAARSGAISAVQTEGATQTANATAQAQAAATSATTASTKASEASASATTATTKATEAAASATSAANAASAAQGVLESIPEGYSDLSEDVVQLKADLQYLNGARTIYVNGSTGSDSNNGLTSGTAVATIQKAVDLVGALKNTSPNGNTSATLSIISVTAGTYAPFVVDGKNILFQSAGTITISASSAVGVLLKNGANVIIQPAFVVNQSGNYNAISVNNNSCLRAINALTVTSTGTAIAIFCAVHSELYTNGILTVTATSVTGQCIYAQYSSSINIVANNSAVDSAKTALFSHSGSRITITGTLTISSNAETGLYAAGGDICYRSVTNNATTTKEKTEYGGRIYKGSQTEINSYGLLPSGTDLNTVTTSGVYRLRGTYTNAPDISNTQYGSSTIVGNLFVINPGFIPTEESQVQILTYAAAHAVFHRSRSGANWYNWTAHGGNSLSYLKDENLDNVKDTGLYIIEPRTYTYVNYPLGTTIPASMYVLRGYFDHQGSVQILLPAVNSIAPLYRVLKSGGNPWVAFGKNNDTSNKVAVYNHPTYTPLTYNPQTAIKLKVGTINIGHFNYGDSSNFGIRTEEYDAKLHNWREFFCKQQFDFVNLNEFVPYIDFLASGDALTGTKLTTAYVLKPQFQYFDSTMDTARKDAVIASKYPISNEAEYTLTGTVNNGYCKYHNVAIDNDHTIGVYGIQMSFRTGSDDTYDSAASIANRKAQLDSLATVIGNHNDDYVVIMGDFNTGTSTDYSNIADFCSANNLVSCNGGFLDWIRTYEPSAFCLDNILVSNNIHINNFDSHSDWYGALSTDHYGISAEITLT